MGEIADDHFVELFWSEGTGVGADGGDGPPTDHPAYGGMDAYIRRRTACAANGHAVHKQIASPASEAASPPRLMSVHELLAQEANLRRCPFCGAAPRIIEYPLGVSCSRFSCVPGKLTVYLSEQDAVEAGFSSVVERWNTAVVSPEGAALFWPSNSGAQDLRSTQGGE